MKRRAKQRIIFLGASITLTAVLVTASCSSPSVTTQNITQDQADADVKKVELSLENKSNILASSVTKEAQFTKSKFDDKKYDLEIKSVTVSKKSNTEVDVVVVLKGKNSTIISKEQTITISGFKAPTVEPGTKPETKPGEKVDDKDKKSSPLTTQQQANEEVKKVNLDIDNKSEILASSITKQTDFDKSEYDANKYQLEIKNVAVLDDDDTKIKVTIVLKAKDSEVVSEEQTIIISGFKSEKPLSEEQKLANEEVEKVKLDINGKDQILASAVSAQSDFTKSGFNEEKYTLEIKKVSVSPSNNTEVEVEVTLKAKSSETLSKQRTITISGFKVDASGSVDKSIITQQQADAEVDKVKFDVRNKGDLLASSISKETRFSMIGFERLDYNLEIISVSVLDINSVKVVFKLKVIGSTIESKTKEITITGFKRPSTPEDRMKANTELAKVSLGFQQKSETLASAVDKNSTFSYSGFNEQKYTLQVKSVTTPSDNNTSVIVTIVLREKGSDVVSDERQITISGFKTPTAGGTSDTGKTPKETKPTPVEKPTKNEADEELKKVDLNYENKASSFSSSITTTSPFVMTGFDPNKYTLDIKSVSVTGEDKKSVKVVVALKVKDSEIVSNDREIIISGFLPATSTTGPTPGPMPSDQPVVQPSDQPKDEPKKETTDPKIEKILKEQKDFWNEKIKAIDYSKFANVSGPSVFGALLSFANGSDEKVNIDVKNLKLEVGKDSITLRNEFFDSVKTGLQYLFKTNGGDLTKLSNVFESKANSIDELVKDKAVLKFVDFLKNIATVNTDWAKILTKAFNTQKNIEVKINLDKNEIFVKTSETEFTNLLTFKPEFIKEFKEIFKTLMQTVIVNLAKTSFEKVLAGTLSGSLFKSLWSGTWILSKTDGRNISVKKITPEYLKKSLESSIQNLEAKIKTVSAKDQALSKVKKAIDDANAKITEAKNYIAADKFEFTATEKLINGLKKSRDEVDQQVANVTNDLDELINKIGNSFELKNNTDATTMLPSTVTSDKLQMQESKKLEKQTLTFTTEGYDDFGRVLVSGSVKYGDLTREFKSVPLSIKFKKTSDGYNFLLGFAAKDIIDLKDKKIKSDTIKTEIASSKELQAKITEFLNLTDEKYKEIQKDRVALYLWAVETLKTTDKNKDTALSAVKTNFLDKENSKTFTKLSYLVDTSKDGIWTKLEKLLKLFSFANSTKTAANTSDTTATANEAGLKPYKDEKFVEFVKGFYNDFITKYYIPSAPVADKWVLFEFTLPWLTTRMFLLLEDQLSEEQKTKTIQTLKRFTNSISNYGSVEGTNSTAGKKLIDNFTHFTRNFFVRNWLDLYTQNIKDALKDAQDYKKWIETTDFEKLTKASGSTATEHKFQAPLMILNYLDTIRMQNNFYNLLKSKKSNLKFDAVNFDNLTKWFFEKYMPTNITFAKAKADKGEQLLRIVAVLYLALALNPTQRDAFLAKLKGTELLKNKTYNELKTQIEKIPWQFAKTVWEKTILPKPAK